MCPPVDGGCTARARDLWAELLACGGWLAGPLPASGERGGEVLLLRVPSLHYRTMEEDGTLDPAQHTCQNIYHIILSSRRKLFLFLLCVRSSY
jgi:hypothetical protein